MTAIPIDSVACPPCRGTGRVHGLTLSFRCGLCEGVGRVTAEKARGFRDMPTMPPPPPEDDDGGAA